METKSKNRTTDEGGFLSRRFLIALPLCAIACAITTGTLLAFMRAEVPAKLSNRTLTFKERVGYQRAIEDVYWRHRIWPKGRPDAKPSLDAVISQAQLEKKVGNYWRKSQALENYWQQPITAAQLQIEMERMARDTKQPQMLRELFESLGNDPLVIAECLARPILSERLVTNFLAHDQGSWGASAEFQTPNGTAAADVSYTLPAISDGAACSDIWAATNATNTPTARASHTAVWTGTEMIVWGGSTGSSYLNTGGLYNPGTDSWTATSTTNAPDARASHTAVWTGTEMIVWGGNDGSNFLNTGGRYNPGTDSWTATSTTNAPVGRQESTAVWTGSEMIVWGGFNGTYLSSGGRYNPSADSWIATGVLIVPKGRADHSAIWTGSEMIVWGGFTAGIPSALNDGGRYNPGADSWIETSTVNVPPRRFYHSAIWTGNEMIIWGGWNDQDFLNTGGRYNPDTDSWIATSMTNVPGTRFGHRAVWTGSEMIVWGGWDSSFFNTGGRFDPSTDSWTPTSTTDAPSARWFHTAVWTGNEMLVWGGANPNALDTGGRYCTQSSPTATPTATPQQTCTVKEVSSCNNVVSSPPTDFIVEMSCLVDQVQPSGFRVNDIGANSFKVSKSTITFHFNTSPVVPGLNTIHILNDAITCCIRLVSEFTCTFTYVPTTPAPRPMPTPRVRPTPLPRP